MSKFRPRLARYNNGCCEQVMPAPVIPICAVSCSLPRPIAEVNYSQINCNQITQQTTTSCAPCQQQSITSCTTCETSNQIQNTVSIQNYILGNSYPTGTILTNTTGNLPQGYLLCDGSIISRTQYSELFNVIGTMYGEGDHSFTFNLPDLSGANESIYIIKT
jgi:hypothetical protein